MIWLVPAFFVTALLYASVGFGGGSTYSALLALAGVDYRILPLISLCCNIAVVSGSIVRFARASIIPWRGALGITAVAAPTAFLGGLTPIGESSFLMLLGGALVLTSASMLLPQTRNGPTTLEHSNSQGRMLPVILAAAPIGYLAGLVGIGGGIFLAPLLHLIRWRETRAIAATASLFILVNSLFGLAGQLVKGGVGRFEAAVAVGLPLLIAVVIGGQIGSYLAVKKLRPEWIRWGTAILTLWVGIRLLTRT